MPDAPAKGSTYRTSELRRHLLCITPQVCAERACLLTEAYKAHSAEPMTIRRARALAHVLANMSIYILDGELVVGNQASHPRAAPLFPEFAVDWMEEELDQFENRPGDVFLAPKEVKRALKPAFEWWKGRTHMERVMCTLPDEVKKAREMCILSEQWALTGGDGHLVVDFEKLLRVGLNGIIAEAEAHLARLNLAEPADLRKLFFLKSVVIALRGAIDFARRFAGEARRLASTEKSAARKAELERIAGVCDRVPAEPARTFHEAVQSAWFAQLMLQIENNGHSVSLGRFDQYTFPYYERDVKDGRLTREQALELVECLWLKLFSVNKIREWFTTQFNIGYPMFQNVTLGGQTPDGRDATNEVSHICLDALSNLQLPQPSVSVRYHVGCPHEFLLKCCETIRLGTGMPAMYNDESMVPALLNRGIPMEDALNYAMVGCVEPTVPGKFGYRVQGACYFNMPKILELALNGGRDPRTGYRLCPGNGDLSSFGCFDDVMDAWRRQVKYYLELHVIHSAVTDLSTEEMVPNPFCSALVDECVRRGRELKHGGAVYDLSAGSQVGLASVANSLAAIKKLVFEQGTLSGEELHQALLSNFDGERGEEIRRLLVHEAPKYGNDDDYVDLLAKEAYGYYVRECPKYKNMRYGLGPLGCHWHPSTSTVASNVPLGLVVGATPDGRRAGEALSDGVSPYPGTDVRGPTAVARSVSKLDNTLVSGGQLLNVKFSPATLASREGLEALAALLRAYFALKGMQIQFNVISVETLRAAQKNPELYRDLVVRVAGYSAQFVTLYTSVQEMIISRTEHTLGGRS